ncbi:MAG: hypothetical protein ACHQ7N_17410 [Candidatus Methylomirabilales bacterium]
MPGCWKCHRDLGPMLEHQKMVTEKGPICYACFNSLQEEAYQAEQARRAAEQPRDEPS